MHRFVLFKRSTILGAVILSLAAGGLAFALRGNPPGEEIRFDGAFLTEEERIQDFDYLYDVISANYPYFWVKMRLGYGDWREKKSIYRDMVAKAGTPHEFYAAVAAIMRELHNWHSSTFDGRMIEDYVLKSRSPAWQSALTPAMPARKFWDETARGVWKEESYLRSYYLGGAYYMSFSAALDDGTEIPYGARIESIDGLGVDEFVGRHRDDLYLLKDASSGKAFAENLFDVFKGDEPIDIELSDPDMKVRILNDAIGDMEDCFVQHHWAIGNLATADLVKDEVAYVRINSFGHGFIEKDIERLSDFFERHSGFRAVIIDIRGNGGGSTTYWQRAILETLLERKTVVNFFVGLRNGRYIEPFAEEKFADAPVLVLDPKDYPPSVPPEIASDEIDRLYAYSLVVDGKRDRPYPPRIYLVVDRYVYSASEAFAAFVKASGWATLVGEQTGGDGVGFDPVPIVLPNSRLAVRFPADIGLLPSGEADEESRTSPDIRTLWSAKEWVRRCDATNAGADPVSVLLEYDPDVDAVFKDLKLR